MRNETIYKSIRDFMGYYVIIGGPYTVHVSDHVTRPPGGAPCRSPYYAVVKCIVPSHPQDLPLPDGGITSQYIILNDGLGVGVYRCGEVGVGVGRGEVEPFSHKPLLQREYQVIVYLYYTLSVSRFL